MTFNIFNVNDKNKAYQVQSIIKRCIKLLEELKKEESPEININMHSSCTINNTKISITLSIGSKNISMRLNPNNSNNCLDYLPLVYNVFKVIKTSGYIVKYDIPYYNARYKGYGDFFVHYYSQPWRYFSFCLWMILEFYFEYQDGKNQEYFRDWVEEYCYMCEKNSEIPEPLHIKTERFPTTYISQTQMEQQIKWIKKTLQTLDITTDVIYNILSHVFGLYRTVNLPKYDIPTYDKIFKLSISKLQKVYAKDILNKNLGLSLV